MNLVLRPFNGLRLSHIIFAVYKTSNRTQLCSRAFKNYFPKNLALFLFYFLQKNLPNKHYCEKETIFQSSSFKNIFRGKKHYHLNEKTSKSTATYTVWYRTKTPKNLRIATSANNRLAHRSSAFIRFFTRFFVQFMFGQVYSYTFFVVFATVCGRFCILPSLNNWLKKSYTQAIN